MQLALTADLAPVPIGDELDRDYTPDRLALTICRRLDLTMTIRRVVEPSVGGGAFARAARATWPHVIVHGVDVDPDAAGVRWCDSHVTGSWLDEPLPGRPYDLVLGNPPFSGTTAVEHVEHALVPGRARYVALILPLAYLAVDRWAHLLRESAGLDAVWPIRPRPWGERVRETAVYVWAPGTQGTMRIDPLEWR
jgi:hypothetical protein